MSVEKLSRKLFTLPKIEILATLYVVLAFSFYLLNYKAFLFLILLTTIILTSIKLLSLKFNLKRTLFLSLLISLLGFVSHELFGSFAGSFFLLISVIHFCSERGFIPSAFVSSIPFLIIEPNSLIFLVLSSALFYAYLRVLNVKVANSTMREFVESFVKFWLTNDPRSAEEILSKNSELFKGKVRCLSVNEFRLISTDFHPGPFRNVGGAKLVNFLNSPFSVYFHSPTTHEKDPVSEEDLKKIRTVLNCNGTELSPLEPFELESENFKLFCFPFDKKKLIFVSGKKRMDDFFLNSNNFIVDCHNANFFGELTAEEIKEIQKLVEKAENIGSEAVGNVKGSFLKLNVETESISNYVSAILLVYGDRKFAIVVFDSNNVDLAFRELVEKKFEEIGFKAIVCSTDNHFKTGIRVRESYKPAGGCEKDFEVLELLLEKCKNLKFEDLHFRFVESDVEVRVLGSLKSKVENLASGSGKYIFLFFILVFVDLILSIFSKAI
ncbi:MAG: DUF2070 family protein [Archaeoglobales archaeon]|nr:DUF2070 family protein [Archaeoglobales archaeon]